jgi:hypothetical protein
MRMHNSATMVVLKPTIQDGAAKRAHDHCALHTCRLGGNQQGQVGRQQ